MAMMAVTEELVSLSTCRPLRLPWGSAAAMMSNSSLSLQAPLSLMAAMPKLRSFHSLRSMAATPMSGYSCTKAVVYQFFPTASLNRPYDCTSGSI